MLVIADVVALCLSTVIIGSLTGHLSWPTLVFPVISTLVLALRGTYATNPLQAVALDNIRTGIGSVSLGLVTTVALMRLAGADHVEFPLLRLWVSAAVGLACVRVGLTMIQRNLRVRGTVRRSVLIIGAGTVGARITRRLREHPEYGLEPVGFIDEAPPLDRSTDLPPLLGSIADLEDLTARTGARSVLLAFGLVPDHYHSRLVERCDEAGVELLVVPRLFESMSDRVSLEHIGETPLVRLRAPNPRSREFAFKHGFDRAFAFVCLLALSPVLSAIALAVFVSDPGPILFRQRRVGRDGRIFNLLKFRSMRQAPQGGRSFELVSGSAPGGIEGDDRRTQVGRWLRRSSLDELPQLVNVLRGEMSLIGPRPERPEFVERFSSEISGYDDRHRVKSGITGWAQVHGLRGQTSISKRVDWDNYYIRNFSLWLDLKIFVLTFIAVCAPSEP